MVLYLLGGGNNGTWINVSTVNTFLTRVGSSSQNTRELISVALANKFLYSANLEYILWGEIIV